MKWSRETQFVVSANFHDGAVVANFPYENYPGGGTWFKLKEHRIYNCFLCVHLAWNFIFHSHIPFSFQKVQISHCVAQFTNLSSVAVLQPQLVWKFTT